MVSFEYTVKDELGIHARPAGLIVKEAAKYTSKLTMKTPNKEVDMKRIMAVMSAAVKCGDSVTVVCEGEDEAKAGAEMEAFFKANL